MSKNFILIQAEINNSLFQTSANIAMDDYEEPERIEFMMQSVISSLLNAMASRHLFSLKNLTVELK